MTVTVKNCLKIVILSVGLSYFHDQTSQIVLYCIWSHLYSLNSVQSPPTGSQWQQK